MSNIDIKKIVFFYNLITRECLRLRGRSSFWYVVSVCDYLRGCGIVWSGHLWLCINRLSLVYQYFYYIFLTSMWFHDTIILGTDIVFPPFTSGIERVFNNFLLFWLSTCSVYALKCRHFFFLWSFSYLSWYYHKILSYFSCFSMFWCGNLMIVVYIKKLSIRIPLFLINHGHF